MTIESENTKQEVQTVIEKCIKCGLCKARCPVFKILKEETFFPRGQISILEEGIYDKILYSCSLCENCEKDCPVEIKITDAIRKARSILVGEKKDSVKAKNLLKNVLETGNIYGL